MNSSDHDEFVIDRYSVTDNWQTNQKCAACIQPFRKGDYFCVVNSGDITRCWFHPACLPGEYRLSQVDLGFLSTVVTPDLFGGPVKA